MTRFPTFNVVALLQRGIPALLVSAGLVGGYARAADDGSAAGIDHSGNYFKISGYLRAWLSYNLENQPDTINYATKWTPQMERLSASLAADAKTGPVQWRAVERSDQERLTSYEGHLQDLVRRDTPGGPGSEMLEQYRRTDLREFYGEVDIGDRVHLRMGKQQVVWGETDFFHPTDLIQGYDYRWRSFLESESDELRKPLIMINSRINVPEVNGGLQLVLRPGIDRREDIGNSYELEGGRWMIQPNKGVDFLALTQFDFDHPAGKYKDPTGGLRWTGIAGSVNYAMSWLRTFNPDPVLNPRFDPYIKTPTGALGDWFYPMINVYSASVSGDIPAIDTVVNGEVSWHAKSLFNTGLASKGFAGPVVQKDEIQTTMRIDKQLRWQEILKTNAPSFFSLQVFDTWIRNYNESDGIVESVGYVHGAREHTTIATAFIQFPYMNSRLIPGVAVGRYLQAHDTFVIPSIAYNLGNHWRFNVEADIFFASHEDTATSADPSTGSLGLLAKMSQLMMRATYQF